MRTVGRWMAAAALVMAVGAIPVAVQAQTEGLRACNSDNPDRAIAGCTALIRAGNFSPAFATAYYNRGNAYLTKGQHDRAIEDYNNAIRIDPANAAAYGNRGSAYFLKGDYDRAIESFDRALQLNPADTRTADNRRLALARKAGR